MIWDIILNKALSLVNNSRARKNILIRLKITLSELRSFTLHNHPWNYEAAK